MDAAVEVLLELHKKAYTEPDSLRGAPLKTPVRRVDEVSAARNPVLRYIGDIK